MVNYTQINTDNMKSKELLEQFTKYCQEHPQQRFWQALRNWCGKAFIFAGDQLDSGPLS